MCKKLSLSRACAGHCQSFPKDSLWLRAPGSPLDLPPRWPQPRITPSPPHSHNSLPSDTFPWCFWFIPWSNTGAKLNCSDQQKTGWKVKQPEFTKSMFHDYTDCGLIPVLAPFCRKAGRKRSCYSETSGFIIVWTKYSARWVPETHREPTVPCRMSFFFYSVITSSALTMKL